ncbi:MAG: Amuc_1100 family pilus-like protein [Kiritimatiellae bacterium]|nr:Amuc_1100 family pilus-like protein [Kiritimatiellia bacterium]
MNKNKIIMIASGAIAVLATLVLAYMGFSTYSEQEEKVESIDAALEKVRRINNEKIAPINDSVAAINQNTAELQAWYNEAKEFVQLGDLELDSALSPSLFKERMMNDAAGLKALQGANGAPLVKADFGFGFGDLLAGGSLPPTEKIVELSRQWSDIKLFTEALAKDGATEILDIVILTGKTEEKVEEAPKKGARGSSRGASAKKNVKKEEPKAKSDFAVERYMLVYRARPAAHIKFLNELAATQRFATTENLSFEHEDDQISAALASGKKEDAKKAGRGRGRKAQAEEEASEESEVRTGYVNDASQGGELKCTLFVATYDFNTKTTVQKKDEVAE